MGTLARNCTKNKGPPSTLKANKRWRGLCFKSSRMEGVTLKTVSLFIVLAAALLGLARCGNKEQFTAQSFTENFTQDFNPEVLDILWMLDTRSNISRKATMKSHLEQEANRFFSRLDTLATSDYRMGIVNHDANYGGSLLPKESPVVIGKNTGTKDQRVAYFSSLISKSFNLSVSATNRGFENVRLALTSSFVPRAAVPLVLIFLSDSDDYSLTSSSNAQTYGQNYLGLKNNQANLIRVYSVNYLKTGSRCATENNADIDKSGFRDTFFSLANLLQGSTADLCGNFSSSIDLSGLKTKTLPKKFHLERTPNPTSIKATVYDSRNTYAVNFQYDAATNEVIFDVAPPQGTIIQISYNL